MKKLTIGVFVPSAPAHLWFEEKYEFSKKRLLNLGFEIVEGRLIKEKKNQNYRTAPGKERAHELMELVKNPNVDILMPVIGGYNSASLIPYLDFKIIDNSNKILCGYSDITALHLAFLSKTNLPCIYGSSLIPTFGEFKSDNFGENSFLDSLLKESYELLPPKKWSDKFLDAFTDEWKTKERKYKNNSGWKILNSGNITGEVLIFNISTLVSLLASDFIPNLEDKILVLEEMDATIFIEERNLNSLKLAGVFDIIKGLIFSKPEIYNDNKSNIAYEELIKEVVGQRDYPIIYNFDCGHTSPSLSLPQRSTLSLKATTNEVKMKIDSNYIVRYFNQ